MIEYELGFPNQNKLQNLSQQAQENLVKIRNICLIHKEKILPAYEVMDFLSEIKKSDSKPDSFDFSVNLALKYIYDRNLQVLYQNFLQFISLNHKASQFLIVSGNPKKKNTSLELLQKIKKELENSVSPSLDLKFGFDLQKFLKNKKIATAYNPFLEAQDLEVETDRLYKKLATGLVSKIYFQIGIDTDKIIKAVQLIKNISPNLKIALSILHPTPKNLGRLTLMPWLGVYLSSEYLSSTEKAKEINEDLFSLAESLNLDVVYSAYNLE